MKSPLALFLVLLGLGFLPLAGGFRYEAALLAGLLAPAWAGCAVARAVPTWFARCGQELLGRQLVGLALSRGAWHLAGVLLAATIHELFGVSCEPWRGLGLFVLGPGLGVLWSSLLAAALAAAWLGFARQPGAKSSAWRLWTVGSLGLVAPISSALLELTAFYTTPAVYAFDPFVGYFGGPLYDLMEYPLQRLLLLRVGTISAACAVVLALSASRMTLTSRGPRLVSRWFSLERWATAALAWSLAFGFSLLETQLGLASTTSSIEEALPGRAHSGSCRVVYAAEIDATVANRTARECRQHVAQLGEFFGVAAPHPITVYLFANPRQKGRLMGAKSTYIAKPWRREVYLQPQAYPHPVLAHELAHVLAGELTDAPLGIAWGGLLPDPGRIEGLAVAAAPRELSEGTAVEWAAAMERLGLLPPAKNLFSLGFFQTSAARSYTAAGSFISFLHEKYGSDAVNAWYGGADLPALVGADWVHLESAWRQHLRKQPISKAFLEMAEARFSAPAIFARNCPHAVDRALARARATCGLGSPEQRGAIAYVRARDPDRRELGWMMPRCSASRGLYRQAAEGYREALEGELGHGLPPQRRVQLLMEWGDTWWARGELKKARALFLRGLELPKTRYQARALQLRAWALSQADELPRRALRQLLVSGPGQGFDTAAPMLGQWLSEGPEPGLAAYLLGRNLLHRAEPTAAQRYLTLALQSEQTVPGVEEETARLLVVAGCMRRDPRAVEVGLSKLQDLPAEPMVLFGARHLADRCLR